jgi:hypothetical protein
MAGSVTLRAVARTALRRRAGGDDRSIAHEREGSQLLRDTLAATRRQGMAMRETERSARLYFLIGGGLGTLYGLWLLVDLITTARPPGHPLTQEPIAAWYIIIISIIFSALFVIAGIDLPRALRTGAIWILRMLVVTGMALLAWLVVLYLSSDVNYDPDRAKSALVAGLVGIAVPVALVAYLYVNIRRLSAEARAAPPTCR